jgi:hypothetical protein
MSDGSFYTTEPPFHTIADATARDGCAEEVFLPQKIKQKYRKYEKPIINPFDFGAYAYDVLPRAD